MTCMLHIHNMIIAGYNSWSVVQVFDANTIEE